MFYDFSNGKDIFQRIYSKNSKEWNGFSNGIRKEENFSNDYPDLFE